jgi:hypothetical protein
MNLNESINIIIASLMGAAISQIITIFANRRFNDEKYNLWYKIKFYLLIIDAGLFVFSILCLLSF